MTKTMTKIDDTTVLVPAGTWVLGDPCYACPNDEWMTFLESADYQNERLTLVGQTSTGHTILGFSTQYGDGCFVGSDGFEYGVDAGLIGLVPADIAKNLDAVKAGREGTLITFTHDTECFIDMDGDTFRGGNHHILTFGAVKIETGDGEEDEDVCGSCYQPESWGCGCDDEDDE